MNLIISEINCSEQEKYGKKMRRGVAYNSYKAPIKTQIYFFPEGENILQNLQNRRQRPHDLYRKLLPQVIEQIKNQGIEVPEDIKFSWSQKAGCNCGCSPGFITSNWIGKEVFVKVRETCDDRCPAVIEYNEGGEILDDWPKNGQFHNVDDGPMVFNYDANGKII